MWPGIVGSDQSLVPSLPLHASKIDVNASGMHLCWVSKAKKTKPAAGSAAGKDAKRLQATDPASRRQRAAQALANHPRWAQILAGVDFREPTAGERKIAASLKARARKVRSKHAAAA
jgi:hypothetical protein